jgi:two-component system NarL family sensor kinase
LTRGDQGPDASNAELSRRAEQRGRLVAQALAAEDRERRRISQALHDDALQLLLMVDQDLAEVDEAAGSEALERAREGLGRAIRRLRDTALELHPLLLERKGLDSALDAIAQGAAALGGFRCEVEVAPEAIGASEQLVLSVARELLMNVAKHAEAAQVTVTVTRSGDLITVEVADDGSGIAPGRPEAALAEGHLGLAILGERMDALDGDFELRDRPGGGTVARAAFPADATEA